MEEAAAVRGAASEATADVVPEALREAIDDCVADGSVVPGVATLLSARACAAEEPENLLELAAGVQLIYAGLRLTRKIAHENPWCDPRERTTDGPARADGADGAEASTDGGRDPDVSVLAADVLVARGFSLLSRTDAAADAVSVVRAFGRDQTDRESATAERAAALDAELEADVLELAVATGAAAADAEGVEAATVAADLAPETSDFEPVEAFFDASRRARLAELSVDGGRPLNRND